MLETLNSIDWANLHHAYKSAADVPELIRDIASDNREVRDRAYEILQSNIWHQGTVYEATAYALPFFIELLTEPNVPQKTAICDLLLLLGNGNSYLDVHQWIDYYRNERQKPEFIARLKKELDWVQAARVAFLEGLPVYMKLVEAEDRDLREAIRFVLADCVEDFEMVEPLLMKSFSEETDIKGKTSALQALRDHWIGMNGAKVMDENLRDQRRDFLLTIMQKVNNDLRLRQAAASALLVLTKDQFLDQALQIFKQTILFHPDTYWSIEGSLMPYPKVALDWNFECFNHPDAKIRQSAIFTVFQICCVWRWASPLAATKLGNILISDPSEETRLSVLGYLSSLGRASQLAQKEIEIAAKEKSPHVRQAAEKVLTAISKPYSFERWTWQDREINFHTEELLRILNERIDSMRWHDQPTTVNILYTLGKRGNEVLAGLPLLQRLLQANDMWVRVYSARAIWSIDHGQSEIIFPALLSSIDDGNSDVLAIECLGQMGRLAQEAVPKLTEIVTSEQRFKGLGRSSIDIMVDEAIQETARQAIELIENDLKT